MRKIPLFFLSVFFLLIGTTHIASATTISFNAIDLGGGQWEYTYAVTNDTLSAALEEFTIYYDFGLYDNLQVTSPLADWDEVTADPADILGSPEDGFYDALALGSGISPGQTVSGFSVSFNWLGAGNPGTQIFEVVDPITWVAIESGSTAQGASVPVPEPATILLLGSGVLVFIGVRRRFDNQEG